jgi:hypothetical protein
MEQLKVPVVLIIFNRPDTTEKVLNAIAQARPSRLFVIADGPRSGRQGEAEKCGAARAIIERIDWDCEVIKDYSPINLGLQQRVASGLDRVFQSVNEAIILEDDCIADPTFFRFCDELLEKFRDDERIMVIGGSNFQFGRRRTADSYYFSRYNHSTGWATWRRAWRYYDQEMRLWPMVRDNGWLQDTLDDKYAVRYWHDTFEAVYKGDINSWAFRWTFSCWLQSGLTTLPNVNLISNIGYGADGTNTQERSRFAEMPVTPVTFPLRHPPFVLRDTRSDLYTQRNNFDHATLPLRVKGKLRKYGIRLGDW